MMNFTTPLGDNVTQSETQIGMRPKLPLAAGAVASFESALLENPESVYLSKWTDSVLSPSDTTDVMAEEQQMRKDRQAELSEVINNSPKTFTANGSNFVMEMGAASLSPSGAVLAALGGGLVSKLGQEVMPFFEAPWAKVAAGAVLGTSETGAALAPYLASQKEYSKQLGEEESWKDILGQSKYMFLLGGALGAFIHPRMPIKPVDVNRITQVIKDQVDNGKAVDVDALIKGGIANANADDPVTSRQLMATKMIADHNTSDLDLQISDLQKQVKDKKVPAGINDLYDHFKTIANATDKETKQQLLDQVPDNPVANQLKSYFIDKDQKLGPNDLKFLNDMRNGKEESLVNQAIKENEGKIEDYSEQAKDSSLSEKRVTGLQETISDLKDQTNKLKDRLDTLDQFKSIDSETKQLLKKVSDLKEKRAVWKDASNQADVRMQLKESDAALPTVEEMKANQARMQSVDSNAKTFDGEFRTPNEEKAALKEPIEEEELKGMKEEAKKIDPESEEGKMIEQYESDASLGDQLKKFAKDLSSCLSGKGGFD